jgi:hypothetical protein
MQRSRGNEYNAEIAPGNFAPGLYEYAMSVRSGERSTTFPGGVPQQPGEWPFHLDSVWTFRVSPQGSPLRLLDPKSDYARLSFVRPGERYRSPFFQIAPGEAADASALSVYLPDLGQDTPDRYAASLFIGEAVAARAADAPRADAVEVKLRAVDGGRKTIQVQLIERDGTAWSADIHAGAAWSPVRVPFGQLRIERSILIPSPFPGLWDYWRDAAAHRGASGDHVAAENVERLQLTVFPNSAAHDGDDAKGAAVESIYLTYQR